MQARPTITSAANERLKLLRRLRRRRNCNAGVFLVEGHRQLRAALDAGADVREVYAAPELFLGGHDGTLVSRAARAGARVYELRAPAFRSVAGNARPDGILAVVSRWPTALADLPRTDEPLLLVAQAIERPGNLGAIVRTACGAGADALVSCDPRTDLFHPDTVHGSVGALFHVPVAEASAVNALRYLRERGARIVVATPDSDAAYWEATYVGAVAVVVGSERHGVGERWRAAADEAVAIPMAGAADSLNVAVATGIVLFEAARRRAHAREPVA